LPDVAPRAGDRFPWLRLKLQANGLTEGLFEKLDDTRFNLIMIGQSSTAVEVPRLDSLLRVLGNRDRQRKEPKKPKQPKKPPSPSLNYLAVKTVKS
jgi:hypothetical protein